MILRLGVIDPMLMVGENGGSVKLALLEAILEKNGESGDQEVFGYNSHLQSLNGRGQYGKYILGLVSLEQKRSIDGFAKRVLS